MEDIKAADKEKQANRKKFELSFKSIHEQAKEKTEERAADKNQGELGKDIGIDEKVLNVLMPDETFNEDDFYYFQYFGAKRLESSSKAVNQDKLDVEKFKELRSKLIIKSEDKPQAVFLAKEESEINSEKKKSVKAPIKIIANEQKKQESEDKSIKTSRKELVDYSSSEDENENEKIQKKVKTL